MTTQLPQYGEPGYFGPWEQSQQDLERARIAAGPGYAAAAATLEAKRMELAYLQERMRLLDIPQMQWADERGRHQLALQAVSDYARQTGWYFNPIYIERQYGREEGAAAWEPFPAGPEAIAKAGGVPTLQMAQMLANPRNLAQSLMALGLSPQETGQFLAQQPLTQRLTGYPGVSFGAQGPPFTFPKGRKMPVTETLNWFETQSPQIPLISSMASFAGQESEAFWADFIANLPKGGVVTPTRIG